MRRDLRRTLEWMSPAGYSRAFWTREFARGNNRELRALRPLLWFDAHIADIGANCGRHSLYFRSIAGPKAIIQMFEPNPFEYRHLESLTRRYANLHLHPFALSSSRGLATLNVPVVNGERLTALGTLREEGVRGVAVHERVEVPVRTLDEIAPTLPGPLHFIKCDVEGDELNVLRGATETLLRDRATLFIEIEERHCGDRFEPTLELMQDLGYEGFFFRAGRAFALTRFDLERDQLAFADLPPSERQPPAYVRDFLFLPK